MCDSQRGVGGPLLRLNVGALDEPLTAREVALQRGHTRLSAWLSELQ